MTQTAHTPGPWQHMVSDPAEGYQVVWIKAQPHPAMRGFTKEIGYTSGTSAEDIANARLIAAAPEMLEACRPKLSPQARKALAEFAEACEAMADANRDSEDAVLASAIQFLLEQEDKRQVAIAKAEGRS